jgi:TolB-like protein/class 3 adenylate cyclase/Tfp pilus assembly protein PilF
MFADMVGYSARMEQDEERVSVQVARSVELFRSLIADFGGEVVQVAGDGILALFSSAEQAVRLALHVQREFRDQAVWAEGEPIQFRVALHLGDVVTIDGRVQGHCVNVAARMQPLAEPGSILVTAAIRDAVRNSEGLSMRSLGRPSLKNISQSIEIFAIDEKESGGARVAEPPRQRLAPDGHQQPSVAVLPFTNLSGDPSNEHLCEGIAHDIIANLTRFRSLLVIARHSAFLFDLGSSSAQDIGQRLGARYILSGSLRRSGKRLRIGVELRDAGFDKVVWSDRFDIAIEELFDLLDEVTGAVASRLAVQIDMAERRHEAQWPSDLQAYGLVLRGQQLVLRFNRESNAHARRLFEEAIEIAPDYSRAHSALSRTHNLDWRYSWSSDPANSLRTALDLARRAIELDRLDARGFAELGFSNLYMRQHDESLANYERALALNPNDADIIAEYADSLVYSGQPATSIELMRKAMRLNPYYPDWYLWYLADAYNAMGRPADVIATVHQMQDPSEGRRMLAANFARLGMMEEAQAEAREVLRLHPQFTISTWRRRPPYKDQAILERYIDALRKAGLPD